MCKTSTREGFAFSTGRGSFALRTERPVTRIETEHLFGDERPFAQCHAPTLVRLADGRFLAAWFAGTREGHHDVGIWSAVREASPAARTREAPGEGWSRPRRIARVRESPHWNPVLFALDANARELVVHFKVGESIRRWESFAARSSDAGETWSEPVELVPGDRGGRGAVRCKPIRLASGDWLAGASIERWRRWDAFFDRSPDGISDWQTTPLVDVDRRRVGKGLIQPTLFESPAGVHALFRSTGGRVYRSDSRDDGRTWSEALPTPLPNNNSGIDLARLADGRLALACNPVGEKGGPRTPLSVLFSRDDGTTWPERIDVETGSGEFSYPAIVPDAEGLALAYTWNRRRIAFVRLTRDAIDAAATSAS